MRWWMKMLSALLLVAVMAWLGWTMVNSMLNLVRNADFSENEPDPMFAEEAVIPTRPPELDEPELAADHPTLDDLPLPEGAPVDKTADELIREAQQNGQS